MRNVWSESRTLACRVLAFIAFVVHASNTHASVSSTADGDIGRSIAAIAQHANDGYDDDDRARYLTNLAYLQMARSDLGAALATIGELHHVVGAPGPIDRTLALEIYAQAKQSKDREFATALKQAFVARFSEFDNRTAIDAAWILGAPARVLEQQFQTAWQQYRAHDPAREESIEIVKAFVTAQVYEQISPYIDSLVSQDDQRRYVIEDSALVRSSNGTVLSALVVRDRTVTTAQPTALLFTIYTDPYMNLHDAKRSAAHGYVGVVADARGKRLSPNRIEPWKHESEDTYAVIDWIARQSWSNGKIGMYGASYSAFAQWAAVKHLHPALKTIVPTAATHPGYGLPMQNNVFVNANYAWNFYVANNRYLDSDTYFDRARWSELAQNWFASGRSYRRIETDGIPNPILQEQLQHPSFDGYWQRMTAYAEEFAYVDIPVLSITGYFDDAQPSAVRYLREHLKYNTHADHYLVIGPYDHWGAGASYKSPVVKNYAIDAVAQFDTVELTYAWFDHVMKGAVRPALLLDRINYEVMGANEWRHAPTIEKMSAAQQVLYMSNAHSSQRLTLSPFKPPKQTFVEQTVDLADRSTQNNLYPVDAMTKSPHISSGISFVSEPLPQAMVISGMITAELHAAINKRDMDPTFAVYEISPSGEYFNLSYFLGRASYAKDMTTRHLLKPNRIETIRVQHTPLVSRRLEKGSRLLLVIDVNKNEQAQVNYGTGKNVSDESIADAAEPLHVRWASDSFIRVPISAE